MRMIKDYRAITNGKYRLVCNVLIPIILGGDTGIDRYRSEKILCNSGHARCGRGAHDSDRGYG